jgi:hypothetical protein
LEPLSLRGKKRLGHKGTNAQRRKMQYLIELKKLGAFES